MMKINDPVKGKEIMDRLHRLYVNTPWTGTIEERLVDGILYIITDKDLSLHKVNDLFTSKNRMPPGLIGGIKPAILGHIASAKKVGKSEEEISKQIWLETVIDGVEVFLNIKNINVLKK
jgi:hypothetical protein